MQKYLQLIEEFHENNPLEIDFIKNQLKGGESQDEVEHILDFMYSNKHKKLEGLSYKLMLAKTKKWDIQLQKVSSKDNEVAGVDYEIYLDFGDGFKIVKLISKACYEREGKLMSHCVGSYFGRDTVIYSLRDSKNLPHATLEEGQQIKGKGNGSIDPKYVDYIVKFLEKTGMTVGENEMKNLGYFKLDKIDTGLISDSLYNGYIYEGKLDTIKDKEGRTYKGMGIWDVKPLVDINDEGKFRLFDDIKAVVEYTNLVTGDKDKKSKKKDEDSAQNASSGHSAKNASSGHYAKNASSGHSAKNASSGHYAQNASSGHYAKNASSGHSAKNASSGHYAKNASSGHYAQNASSGHYAKNASSGDSAQNASSGDYAKNASSGDSAKNASSGDSAQNASSGNYTTSIVSGKYSITADIGFGSKSKGIIGTWIVLAEYAKNTEGYWYPKNVKCSQIDGIILKENTFYILKDGEFQEAE